MDSVLKRIEPHYPIEKISVNGRQCWPYLRWPYHSAYRASKLKMHGESRSAARAILSIGLDASELANDGGAAEADLEQPEVAGVAVLLRTGVRRLRRKVRTFFRLVEIVLRNLPRGFRNWFRRYDYIMLTDESIRKKVGDRYMNTFLDPIVDEIGPGRVLCIESAARFHRYRMREIHTRRAVSHTCPALLAVLLRWARRLFLGRYRVANRWVIDSIESDFESSLDVDMHIELFEARRAVFSLLFRIMRPRALLLTVHYNAHRMAAIAAAKSMGIKVVEVQHGVIGREHAAYNVYGSIDRNCFPDHLLVIGKREVATFNDSRMIEPANVHPVGSFYIDHIRANCSPDAQLSDSFSVYEKVVGVTLQWLYLRRLIEFIVEAARMDCTILYILIPRQSQMKACATLALPSNVVIIEDKNFYELMAYCDFHTTVSSTCALEAPALGVQNILVDIDGGASKYYRSVLTDDRVTRFADTPGEYLALVKSFSRLERDSVCELHKDFFARNYRENIRKFVKTHLL